MPDLLGILVGCFVAISLGPLIWRFGYKCSGYDGPSRLSHKPWRR